MATREMSRNGLRATGNHKFTALCQWAAVISSGVGILLYIRWSLHWPLIHDMQVIHYVSFLIDKGWAPYRQIGDMNMPGAYLVEGWALHTFGNQDIGWRFYDFLLAVILTGAEIAIARRYDWRAGFLAGALFTLGHGAEGPINAGQRDQVVAVALILGYAFCFEAVRRGKCWLMLPVGLMIALATSIKPTVILAGPLLLAIVLVELYRRHTPILGYVAWSLLGYAVIAAAILQFLLSNGSLRAFLYDLTRVLPHYATLTPGSRHIAIHDAIPRPLLLYLGCVILILLTNRLWRDWEQTAILSGIAIGLLNYFAQKGATQHRYPLTAFLLLWASIQIFVAFKGSNLSRAFATVGVLLATLILVPRYLQAIRQYKPYDLFSSYLESDLEHIGTQRLQGRVQCLDIVDGCLNALYHLKIVQSTGSTGDLLFFLQQHAPVVDRARADFWRSIQADPPAVFVLSNSSFLLARTFDNLNAWPQLASYLAQNYTVTEQRAFPPDVPPTADPAAANLYPAYRIYVRRGTVATTH